VILHTRLSHPLKRAALQEAAKRRVTLRSVLETALRDRYDPDRAGAELRLVVRELKALRREVAQVSAGNRVVFEALGLLVKNLFSSLTPPTSEGRIAGDVFYARFIEAVVRAVEKDEALMDQVLSLAIVAHDAARSETLKEKSDA
jgi:hypothetical protein